MYRLKINPHKRFRLAIYTIQGKFVRCANSDICWKTTVEIHHALRQRHIDLRLEVPAEIKRRKGQYVSESCFGARLWC